MVAILRRAICSPRADRAILRYREAMLPGLRRHKTLPSIASVLLVTGAVSAAIALAPIAVDAGVTAGRAIGQMSSGRSITVDGIEIGVPKPGMGVGVSETHPDGSTTDIRITTDLSGHVTVTREAPQASTVAPALPSTSSAVAPSATTACGDPKFNLTGSSWREAFHWSFKSSSTPSNLLATSTISGVEAVLKHAIGNITHERNDCDRVDHVSARAIYDGRTNLGTHIGTDAACRRTDGHNVVAFGDLPPSTLGFTCWWFIGSRTIEADTVLNKGDFTFVLTTRDCVDGYILEDVATHEFGHVFGLGHVNQEKHAALTMSPQIYSCDPSDITLGLGDMNGLERLY
jgi:Matrixin